MINFNPEKDIGRKVIYRPYLGKNDMRGTIVRAAKGKPRLPTVVVHFEGEETPRPAYCSDLEWDKES